MERGQCCAHSVGRQPRARGRSSTPSERSVVNPSKGLFGTELRQDPRRRALSRRNIGVAQRFNVGDASSRHRPAGRLNEGVSYV